jgi:anti-sigma B factor antagonist
MLSPAQREQGMPLQEWSESTLIAELSDEPLFSEEFEALMGRLEETGDDMPDVILNLLDVSRLNSTNLAQLLRLRKKLLSHERRLRICSVDDSIWSVFMVTGLEKLFEFTDDVATSLASLQIESGRPTRD